MTAHFQPPLRLTLISSTAKPWPGRIRELERILTSSASGIGWDLGELESVKPGEETLGEHLEIRAFQQAPAMPADQWLDETLHSMILVLVDDDLLGDSELLDWLEVCAAHVLDQGRRHHFFALPAHEGNQQSWLNASDPFKELQVESWSRLDREQAGRLDHLALQVLDRLIKLLADELFERADWKLRIFLSHAKQDGLHLARSFQAFLERLAWIEHFYDARDIEAGEPWKEALRRGVENSVLLALRTDAYDGRSYCKKEVLWAARYGVPRVVVDARSGLVHPASTLALDGAPGVRVPDGNLPRVLFAVQQTVLRSLLFRSRVREFERLGLLPENLVGVRIVASTPTVEALDHACRMVAAEGAKGQRWILYPEPDLPEGLNAAAMALADGAGARLATPKDILSEQQR